ncbi:MAG: glycosyltransferase family 4 protein [Verrucomicrobiota bacterium]
MNIIQITPGAGKMFCGGCFRDNALVAALRQLGHSTLMVPLYLPLTLDEPDQSQATPIFFGGINVYLEQKSGFFRKMPKWLHRLLDSPRLLDWVAGSAANTRPEKVGELTLSMVRGEEGNQARELDELVAWLKTTGRPDVVCLSNTLLLGMARRIKSELNVPMVCTMQGEDTFLDSLPESVRERTWQTLVARATEIDLFIAPSRYYGNLMRKRLQLEPERVRVVYNGIKLEGYRPADTLPTPPVLGYFSRMCQAKGLDTLVEAFIQLKTRERFKNLKLRVGGGMGPSDKIFVDKLKSILAKHKCLGDTEFCPNLDRVQKQAFFRSLTVMSAPALYGEAFGLYVIEALASGVPVVQPRHAAFPELIEATNGGLLCEPGNATALADGIERLLLDPQRARAMGEAGRNAVLQNFSVERMARDMVEVFQEVSQQRPHSNLSKLNSQLR